MKSKLKSFAVWLILGIIFIVLLSSIIDNTNTKMTYSELITKMELGEVKKIELSSDGESAYVTLKNTICIHYHFKLIITIWNYYYLFNILVFTYE